MQRQGRSGYQCRHHHRDLAAELAALTPVVERLGQPTWQAYVLQVKASARLLEGRFAEAAELNDRALAVGGPDSEAAFLHVIFRAASARLTESQPP
jgi:hypothetical protein